MELNNILNFWFPNQNYQQFWFDGSKDRIIYDNFNAFLLNNNKNSFDQIIDNFSNTEIFSFIILYDQLTRNIVRYNKNYELTNEYKLALQLSLHLLINKYEDELNFNEQLFLLLPLRHTNKKECLDLVIYYLKKIYQNISQENKNTFKKFYFNTLSNYSNITQNIFEFLDQDISDHSFSEEIHDMDCKNYSDITLNGNNNHSLYNTIKSYCKNYKNIGISLSGGVDSMVIMYILKQLEIQKIIDKVVAIHINYNWCNRNELESVYLQNICKKLQVPLILRNITCFDDDTKIIDIDRELIDSETRNTRYNTYKYAINKYSLDGICLGHHKGDMIENVFMNMFYGDSLLNLFAMSDKQIIDGVMILRPLLPHIKKDIFEYAELNNITYFKDTTPKDCFRGVLRNEIFPLLEKFNSGAKQKLYNLGEQSSDLDIYVKQNITNILGTKKKHDYGYSLEIENHKNMPYVLWSKILSSFFHSEGIHMMTKKNMKYYIDNIYRGTKIRLSNGFYGFYDGKKTFHFIKQNSLESFFI